MFCFSFLGYVLITALQKVAQAQQNRDVILTELLQTMSTALAFTQRAEKTSIVEHTRILLLEMAKKLEESALFIRHYARNTGFGECTILRIQYVYMKDLTAKSSSKSCREEHIFRC